MNDYCQLQEGTNPYHYPGASHCAKRFITHHWHVLPDKDLPVCCFCDESAVLPGHSCVVESSLLDAYMELIQRNGRAAIAAPINGFSMSYREGDRSAGDYSIETKELATGIIRIYVLGMNSRRAAHMFRVAQCNIENLQSGKIERQYRTTALQEIEAQLSYLPKQVIQAVEKPNRENIALAHKLAALKGRFTPKQPQGKSKKGKGRK